MDILANELMKFYKSVLIEIITIIVLIGANLSNELMVVINNDKSGFNNALPLGYSVNAAHSLSIVVDELKFISHT
jgi:hypothetical protein